ncbi:phosphotransferase family protein [Paractinoplanes atraurantiacus]|uniref:Predicted kinase, aminoglycoside phosphotransferase (APT) family n=1 Tax=Paractinoplanes atraurantiacus TaxID=1036182 RepID=A0A285ICC5_9ACTN|nr:aminoglycoside phosphotransferase family protein [Actinoplanes atraurantiacus]SNY45629.1 Predicted kinase, aminoglycoside phosphotransferase (APT) family [Actinoplanes atraurantiacus]
MALSWLDEPTVEALRVGLRKVAPELAASTIVTRGLEAGDDPQWSGASAVVDGRVVVKFAWAEPPARRICREARLVEALRAVTPGLPLPVVVVASRDPAMLVTRRVAAIPFFDVRRLIAPADREIAARDIATVLAGLHDPRVLAAVGPLPSPAPPASTEILRSRLGAFLRPDQWEQMAAWCDWADRVLASPGRTVLVHGDFHGDNHLWDAASRRLSLVVDWETAGPGEPEFDLRCLPGDCGIELFLATVVHYERLSGTTLNVDRIMAWHLRTVLGDALWRAEAGVSLPDHRTPPEWVDDLNGRFAALGTFGWGERPAHPTPGFQ